MSGFGVKRLISEINGKWFILFLFFETVFFAGWHYQENRRNQEVVEIPNVKRFENFSKNHTRIFIKTNMLERQSYLIDGINATDGKEVFPNEKTRNLNKKGEKIKAQKTIISTKCNIDLCSKRRFSEPKGKPIQIKSDTLPTVDCISYSSDIIICDSYMKLPSDNAQQFCTELENFQKEHNLTSYWSLSKYDRFRLSSLILNNMGYEQRIPNLIGLGVKKTGSSAMLELLGFHPQVFSFYGENGFFSLEERYRKGLDFYRCKSLFSKEGDITFEKTTRYFEKSDVIPKIMKQMLPDKTKFYVGVRDPVERTISDFHHTRFVELMIANKKLPGVRNKTDCTPESEGKVFMDSVFDDNGNIRPDNMMIDLSYYARHLKSYLEHFPLSSFHIEDASDIMERPIDVLQRMEQFLELDPFYKKYMLVDSPNSDGVTCLHFSGKTECTKHWGMDHPKPYLNETTLKHLRDYFRPLNEEFEEMTGQKFSWTNL